MDKILARALLRAGNRPMQNRPPSPRFMVCDNDLERIDREHQYLPEDVEAAAFAAIDWASLPANSYEREVHDHVTGITLRLNVNRENRQMLWQFSAKKDDAQ
jgi:hypothetical protein